MIIKFIGVIIIIISLINIVDGILSILWAYEPRLLWQMGRFIRMFLGIISLICGIILIII